MSQLRPQELDDRPDTPAEAVWHKILRSKTMRDGSGIFIAGEPDRELIIESIQSALDSGFCFTDPIVSTLIDGRIIQSLPRCAVLLSALRRVFSKQYDFGLPDKALGTLRNERSAARRHPKK